MIIKNIVDTLPKHQYKTYGKRPISKIKRIVIHHFAGNISIEEAAKYHVDGHGWPGIGYTFVIDKDAVIYATNSLETVCYNVANGNTPTLGIAIRGNYSKEEPSWEVMEALDELISALRGIIGYLPVYVHSDFVATECPGECLRNLIREKYGNPPQALSIKLSWFQRLWNRLKK